MKNKLNLGSGIGGLSALNVITTEHEDWKCIEVCEAYTADEHYDISAGIREADNTIEEIYLGDVFEHFLRLKAIFVAKECYRVLKKGGRLLVSVPDMALAIPKWLESDGSDLGAAKLIWGDQDELYERNSLPDSHLYGYTEKSLKKVFSDVGFTNIERAVLHGAWFELGLEIYK
jgi:predicted SAM-dependent methyltransferase